jgi:hypothetical protein
MSTRLYQTLLAHIWKQTKDESLVQTVEYFGYLQNDIRLKTVFDNNDKTYNYGPSM